MTKLRILLVPDYLDWVLGTWAKEIVRVGVKHEYYYFSQQMLRYHPNQWKELMDNIDVIHFLSDVDFEKLAFPRNIPTIGSIHHVLDWKELSHIPQAVDITMTVAREWQDFLCQKGVPPERICLFKNGVDTKKFYPFDKTLARSRLGISSSSFLIGYSAKYSSDAGGRKGVDILLRSLQTLVDLGYNFGVLITGPGWSKTIKKIKTYGISEIYYFPFLPDTMMPTCHNALDCYVVTAKVEGGPVPVLNNMACGVPVVTTPVGIVREYIQDGINGLVVPKDDVESTAKAVARLLQSPDLCDRLAKAALKTIESDLTWDKTLAGIEQLYENVWKTKIDRRGQKRLNTELDPAAQRQWAVSTNSYLWNLKLCLGGHPIEGLLGILKGDLKLATQESARVFAAEVNILMQRIKIALIH